MRKLLCSLLLVLSIVSLSAQHPPPSSSALSAERLARLDKVMQQYVDENRLAGVVALVLRDGQPVYERAVGWADKESGRKMTTDTIFRIASQTKAITSVAVLSLVEEGKIGIDDPVSRFIPAFAATKVAVRKDGGVIDIVPARRPITIRHLLTHTAGISYGTDRDLASLYEAKGLGPAAGRGWYTADKTEPICVTMERLARCRSSRSPAKRGCTATTPTCSAASSSARRARRWTSSSAPGLLVRSG
jgi:CubicO group peptidase (beta-lactamase class C family)